MSIKYPATMDCDGVGSASETTSPPTRHTCSAIHVPTKYNDQLHHVSTITDTTRLLIASLNHARSLETSRPDHEARFSQPNSLADKVRDFRKARTHRPTPVPEPAFDNDKHQEQSAD